MRRSITVLVATLLVLTLVTPFFSQVAPAPTQVDASTDAQAGQIIRVGSKAFTENRVLGWIVYHVLTDLGFRVFFQTDDATTFELRQMLDTGEIDVYVEYTGTGVLHLNEEVGDAVPFDAGFDPNIAFATVSTFDAVNNDLTWMPAAPGNNTYALAVMESFAAANGIETVSDFVSYLNGGGEVVLAGGTEFLERRDGMLAFYDTYDFQLLDNQVIPVDNGTPQDTLPMLADGVDGTNIAMAYGTAPELLIGEFVLLEDDLGSQFVYQPAAVFRGQVVRDFPQILTALTPVFASLTNRQLQDLNLAVAEFGDTPSQAALNYLIANAFIVPPDGGEVVVGSADEPQCDVERPFGASQSANLRAEPNLGAEVLANLAAGARLPVDGKRLDGEGFTWWRVSLREETWVREDVVDEIGDCNAVPDA